MTRFHVFCFYVHRLHSITKIARVKYLSNLNFIIRDYAEALRLKYLKYFALQTKTDKFLLHLFASSALCSYIYTYACIFISIFIFRFFFFFSFFFHFFFCFSQTGGYLRAFSFTGKVQGCTQHMQCLES
jgi:hypothetical protein